MTFLHENNVFQKCKGPKNIFFLHIRMMHKISSVIILVVAMFSIFPCGNATLICNKLFGAGVHHWRKIGRISQTSGKKLLTILNNLKVLKIFIFY